MATSLDSVETLPAPEPVAVPTLYPPIPAFVVPEPATLPSFPPPIQALDLPPALAPTVLLKPMSVPTLPQPIPALAFRGPATVPDLLPDLLPVPAPGALVPVAVPSIEPPGLLRRCLTSRTFWMVAIGVVAVAARLTAVSSSYDIFIDEITYTNIATNVAHGHGVILYGQPFSLHPPAAFGLYALVIMVFGLHGGTESVLFALRNVAVVLGAATCVLTYLLAERAGGRRLAAVPALLLAIDPLAITYDSRVMLEAPAQLAAVTMFLCVAVATDATRSVVSRRHWLWAAGLAGATVLCTKETFGLVVVLALAGLVATGWVVARREAATVLGLALLGYGISVVTMGFVNGFGVWWHTQVGGVFRLVGTRQVTGFNAPQTHSSFIARVFADGPMFAVTYLILGFGVLAAVALLWWLEPWNRQQFRPSSRNRVTVLISIWTVSAAAYLVYATLFGTIEEQMYFILLLPAAVSLCLWLAGPVGHRSRPWRAAGALLLGLALVFNAFVWVNVHTTRDDGYRRLVGWEAVHVAPTAVVAATDDVSQFLLPVGVIGQWSTIAELKAHHVDYVVVNLALVQQGYGVASSSFLDSIEHQGHLVFEANGPSDISLRVYDVRTITGAAP